MSLTVVMAGSSGFLGTHLRAELGRRGHEITALVRRPPKGPNESTWDPYSGEVDRDLIASADVVINLAGAPTIGNPHSKKWSTALYESRIKTTETLAEAIAAAPAPPYFVAGNAVAWYGDHGPAELTEAADTRGHSLMTGLCRDWQAAAQPAVDAGARVCVLRTSPVMDRRSEPLKQLRLLFKAGLGGKLGPGTNYMPIISLRDWVGGVVHLAEQDDVAGPVNLVCPRPPTNAEFTEELARQLSRPAFARVPKALIKVGAGRMADEILGSVNARPAVLQASGYSFQDRNVAEILRAGLA